MEIGGCAIHNATSAEEETGPVVLVKTKNETYHTTLLKGQRRGGRSARVRKITEIFIFAQDRLASPCLCRSSHVCSPKLSRHRIEGYLLLSPNCAGRDTSNHPFYQSHEGTAAITAAGGEDQTKNFVSTKLGGGGERSYQEA